MSFCLITFGIVVAFFLVYYIQFADNIHKRAKSNVFVGDCPVTIYQVYDKETGVYYAVTSEGGICPMYTINGEVKLVDQGNEYVVHRNLGEFNAEEHN